MTESGTNMKRLFLGIASIFMLSLSINVNAQVLPVLDFFHGAECPHCQREKAWFPELKESYPEIQINQYEVWHDTANQLLMKERLADLGKTSQGVPTNIIGDQVVSGFQPEAILAALEAEYGPPVAKVEKPEEETEKTSLWEKIKAFFANLFS